MLVADLRRGFRRFEELKRGKGYVCKFGKNLLLLNIALRILENCDFVKF